MTVDVVGHRGARGVRPENTLDAIAHALSLGLRMIEIDVHVTADGIVVVTHDPALHPDQTRGPDGRWLDAPGPRICEARYGDLARYDIGALRPGSPLAGQFPDQEAREGLRIPTLRDVIALCARHPVPVDLLVEVKSDPADPVLAEAARRCARDAAGALDAAGLGARSAIQCFDWHVLADLATAWPGIRRSYLTDARKSFHAGSAWIDGAVAGGAPAMIAARGGAAWAPAFADLDAAGMRAARNAGLAVYPWTVNDPVGMADMARLGVDGIITDYPARALQVLAGMAV